MRKKTGTRTKRKPVGESRHSIGPKLKKYVARNFVALLSILLSVLTSLLIYYSASADPDLRQVDLGPSSDSGFSKPIKDKDGNCFYYATLTQHFKNLSIKSGHIDKVDFIPLSENVVPEFTTIHVDKSNIAWREEKEIEIRFSVALSPQACKALVDQREPLTIGVAFYDNTGQFVNKGTDGKPYYFTGVLTFAP